MIDAQGWWLVEGAQDMRCGIDRLLVAVQALGRDVFSGGAYVFCNRSGTRIKVLCCDGQGIWLCVRRLHRGKFMWKRGEGVCELSAQTFAWLSAGVDWQRLSQRVEDLPKII